MAKRRKLSNLAYGLERKSRLAALASAKEEATRLMQRGEGDAALDILEPLVDDFPRDAELQMMVGACYLGLEDPDGALFYFEGAYELDKEPAILFPLGLAYFQLEMYGSALYAFHESIRRGLPLPDDMQELLEGLRQDVSATAEEVGLPLEKTLRGLRELERGVRLIAYDEYSRAAEANRKAIKILGDWPNPHNNLALCLYLDGQVPAAIAESRQVLARRPDNITATCNLVRFLAWSGDRQAAETAWQPNRLRTPPDLLSDGLTLAEAAAAVDDDESVRRLLQPLADWASDDVGGPLQYVQRQLFLAIADANLGNPKAALRRLRDLDSENPRVEVLRAALSQGKTGLGFTPRFPYFASYDVLPGAVASKYAELAEAAEDGNDRVAAKALKQFVARYPQLVVMAEKEIWEEDAVDMGLLTLRYIATPPAHAALRRFACSQAGTDEQRVTALLYLQVSGGVQGGETLRIWLDGAWQETEARGYTIGPHDEHSRLKPQAVKLMDQGMAAMQEGKPAEAVALLRRVIELEPRAYEAYNNMAPALDATGEHEAGTAMLEQALAINPTYVFARVNLALRCVGQDADAAAGYLEPLAARTAFTPQEFVLYQYALAKVAVAREDYKAAHVLLDLALSVVPDYEPAVKLQSWLQMQEFISPGGPWEEFRARLVDRQARYRHRQQARLATLTPSLADVVGTFTAELLHPIARAVAPSQRLSGLRKAELQQLVIEALLAPATLERIVNHDLNDAERAALAAVLDAGGALPQDQFRAAYGDDAAESPWWTHTPPASVAGRLRLRCLLAETTVAGTVYLAVPAELRAPLAAVLRE
jgi:tetratricopeptide (TPR) repeat protein